LFFCIIDQLFMYELAVPG